MTIKARLIKSDGTACDWIMQGDNFEWDSHELWEAGYDTGELYINDKLVLHVMFTA